MNKLKFVSKNKHAQVMLFVIFGIVVLAIAGVVIYLVSQPSSPNITPSVPQLEDVPVEFKPVSDYVEFCVKLVAEDGIRKMALQGGYIDPLNEDYSGSSFIYDPASPTESDIIPLSPYSDETKLPYWFYLEGKNDCVGCSLSSLAPSIELMESQLSKYVSENIDYCINGFAELETSGYTVTPLSEPKVETTIFGSGQDFLLTYELDITNADASQRLDKFYVRSSLPLKKLYTVAYNITNYEIVTNHIAQFTKYLIALQSGPTMTKLPPISYRDSSRFSMFWMQPVVEQKFQNILSTYIQSLQVLGTENFDDSFLINIPESLPVQRNLYLNAVLSPYPFDNVETQNIDVDFMYLRHPIYLEVWPHEGTKITAKSYESPGHDFNRFLPEDYTNSYNFFYDISYPLVVNIRNKDELNKNNELEFAFALEILIRKNFLMKELLSGQGPINWDYDAIQVTIIDTDTTDPADVSSSGFIIGERADQSLFCEPILRQSGNISLLAYDKHTHEPLLDAYVSVGCGNYDECSIGMTKFDKGAGYFSEKMPLCEKGYVLVDKDEYQPKRIPITTEQDIPKSLGAVSLYKKIRKNISIKKYQMDYDYDLPLEPENLIETESAIITLKLISDSINPPYEIMTTYTPGQDNYVDLIPGKYSIDIMYVDNEGVSVPKNCDRSCIKRNLLNQCTDWMYYPSEDIELKPAQWGGVKYLDRYALSFREQDIYDESSNLEFYILRYPTPNAETCLDSLEDMGKLEEFTIQNRMTLTPKFLS